MEINKEIESKTNNFKENDLNNYSREELIAKIRTLEAHNNQLKNIINKSENVEKTHKICKPFDFSKYRFRHVFLKFYYLGWDHQGYATQEDTINTIEHYLFNALIKTCLIKDRQSSNYHRCGRTDKGVSSFGQVISIDLRSKLSKEDQDNIEREIKYCLALNRVLPDTIQCVAWAPVRNDLSARFDCQSRTYKYFFPKDKLDIEQMRIASQYLLGTHDFRNFCKMDVANGVVKFDRNILEIDIKSLDNEMELNDYTLYVITIKGKAFLWHQIRYIMGILLLIGQNKEEPELVKDLLDIEKNPRKPDYNMASEVPLNLYFCEYDDINWCYCKASLKSAIDNLRNLWTFTAIKEKMMITMLEELEKHFEDFTNELTEQEKIVCLSEYLLMGTKSRRYIPVMKRTLCDSLEDKLENQTKRSKLKL